MILPHLFNFYAEVVRQHVSFRHQELAGIFGDVLLIAILRSPATLWQVEGKESEL